MISYGPTFLARHLHLDGLYFHCYVLILTAACATEDVSRLDHLQVLHDPCLKPSNRMLHKQNRPGRLASRARHPIRGHGSRRDRNPKNSTRSDSNFDWRSPGTASALLRTQRVRFVGSCWHRDCGQRSRVHRKPTGKNTLLVSAHRKNSLKIVDSCAHLCANCNNYYGVSYGTSNVSDYCIVRLKRCQKLILIINISTLLSSYFMNASTEQAAS